jgi:DNA-binding NtrC family response regulator
MNCGATANAVRRCKLVFYGKVPWFHAPAIKIPIGPGTEFGIADCTICKRGLGAPMTISIIDDDQFAREATGDLVQSLGYEVATFESAERFRESGRLAETSCLITDLQMPGPSGLDLQSRLIAAGQRIPVIFITAFPEERFRRRAMNAEAVGFLSKPFEEESLIRYLETALRAQ